MIQPKDNKISSTYQVLSHLNIQNEQEWNRLNVQPNINDFHDKKFDACKKFYNDNVVAITQMKKVFTEFYDSWLVPNGQGGYKMVKVADMAQEIKEEGKEREMIDSADPELQEGKDREAFNKAHMEVLNTQVNIKY